ncbi:hypothetical protein BpHYR1_044734 [Brachionus plicatilis]|uniref:Uncharacterized protein n=1 Tax=Brachionus plicatilis TaxID=10195 RepID=A0A3M7Q7N4_BRAPC|nr:hypothetical protein BpHYR1_044734 [Brachionus plicatilis]
MRGSSLRKLVYVLITFLQNNFKLTFYILAHLINDKLDFSKLKGTIEKRIKIVIGVFLVISLGLSVDKIFSFQINTNVLFNEEADYVEFPNRNTFQNIFIRLRFNSFFNIKYYAVYSYIFYTFFILNFLFPHLCFSINFLVVKLTNFDHKNYCVFNSRICTLLMIKRSSIKAYFMNPKNSSDKEKLFLNIKRPN